MFPLWERIIIQECYVLFSLSLPRSRTNFTSPFFHIAVATRWTGNRGLISTFARKSASSGRWWKESRVIPVSDLVAGEGKNLRSHFSIFQRSKTVPAIVRYPADEYSTVARRIKFSERTKSVPRGLVRKILFWQCFRGNTRVTLFDRRLETKRAALWKDISMILHESSMFYKSRCVFALWRLESANWCRYYLSRWCWS